MKTVTLGGERLGSGEKRKVELPHFERSTHDLSYIWRSTMAPGTLVPFMVEVGLPGDTFDIDLQSKIMTHPTIGPLLGSYKVQFDVFEVPIRNYQAQLHNNKLGIGLKMEEIKLPQLWLRGKNPSQEDLENEDIDIDNYQINSSHILSYLGIRGLGTSREILPLAVGERPKWVERKFNAIPYIAYYDIVKNYYANKSEGIGYFINHNTDKLLQIRMGNPNILIKEGNEQELKTTIAKDSTITLEYTPNYTRLKKEDYDNIKINVRTTETINNETIITDDYVLLKNIATYVSYNLNNVIYKAKFSLSNYTFTGFTDENIQESVKLKSFLLEEIDEMREQILLDIKNQNAFHIATDATEIPNLYKDSINYEERDTEFISKLTKNQQGLAIKTYQSDLYNNWLDEWTITGGQDSIAELSKMKVEIVSGRQDGYLYVDEMIIKRKVYEMLNDIAVSGGSFNDWINAVYDHEGKLNSEIPIYCGGLSKELVFDEVISNAETPGQPLGSLAGRGTYNDKHKGGKVTIKINEPSYIMGIVSLTPRIDYSAGNKWDTDLKTMDDFHKPHMDQIGFQDLITEQMHWADTKIEGTINDGNWKAYKWSAGKIPAWSNYMTNVNVVRGNFANKQNQMFMTLNRRYEIGEDGRIKDLTTYVDPAKHNYIFADTRLDAQNFWMQIAVGIEKRSKMSAKVMPR